ncbi:MAG: amidohydrolase family protein [Sphaerochaetaceae bacterium]|nr:amidohydrolase family protein [Sphaerochaetaceae bacterium]
MSYILVKNGLVTDSEKSEKADVLVKDSKIAKVAAHIDVSSLYENVKVIDADGKYVMPGFIDAHTHYHLVSRGTVTADSFEQGSRLAAFGGVTSVIDFADHDRGETLCRSLNNRLSEMKKGMAIDYTLHQGVYGHGYDETIGTQLEELKKQGVKTLKIFTTYRETGYLIEEREKLSDLFRNAKRLGMLITAHCEYNPLIEEISRNQVGTPCPKDHADLRPSQAEAKAIEYYGSAALEAQCPLYIVHVSSEAGINAVRALRRAGAVIYAETTPTYLFLERSLLEGSEGSLYVMTPPLRTKKDNLALQQAVLDGDIDVIATDHCAFTKNQKLSSTDPRVIYPGIPGTEEMSALLYTFAKKHSMPVTDMVKLISSNPAKIFGIYPQKGSLQEGTDADITVFDPDCEWIVRNADIHSESGYSAFAGMKASGRACLTIVRGNVVCDGISYYGKAGDGMFVRQDY